jgi:xanthine/CO dehydrogenase XdhC/CoxF family maturation factor
MKHWRETAELGARIIRLAELGERAVLATVVDIAGSAYRRPGAKFLIERDGKTLGSVSGGCLEADVCEVARSVIESGAARLLHYDTGSDDRTVWGLGLGCNGSVDVFVQSATEPAALDHLRRVSSYLRGSETFAASTIVDGPTHVGRSILVSSTGRREGSTGNHHLDLELQRVASAAVTRGVSRLNRLDSHLVFTDVLVAPPTLIVCGAGDDAVPLAAYAADAGFSVTVVDHRSGYLSAERFPAARRLVEARPDVHPDALGVDARTMVVVKTHAFAHDRDWLRLFLETEVSYIGLLGPHGRAAEILRQVGKGHDHRVFGPVGLDVGADGPEQIAISIVAELLAVHARQQAGHLRERGAAIHAI